MIQDEKLLKALNETGRKEFTPDYSTFPEQDREWVKALWELMVLAEQKRLGKPELDSTNYNQLKYEPVAVLEKDSSKPSGFWLSGFWLSGTFFDVGSRLCQHNSETAIELVEENKERFIALRIEPKKH